MAASIGSLALMAQTKHILTIAKATTTRILVANYAKKLGGKMAMQQTQKVRLEVESDPQKLTAFCCGANIYVDGKDPEIKDESEYPDWLWTLRTDRTAPDLSSLEYDSQEYWKRLRKLNIKRKNRLRSVKTLK